MEKLTELRKILKSLETRWHSGKIGAPSEIVRLDRQTKEVRKKIQALS